MGEDVYDTVIIGAGPAGMSAGVYAIRAGLKAVVLEDTMAGGQANTSPSVLNYLGFPSISGMDLAEKMKTHASQYVEIKEGEKVSAIERRENFTVRTQSGAYAATTVILATGAHHRRLGVDGEGRLNGKGVSYCATCDGFFFRGKKVVVVGGGNTAATEALYLLGIGADVTVVHRRDQMRAEGELQERLRNEGAKFVWDSVVKEIRGDGTVSSILLDNIKDGGVSELAVEGVFVAIGISPNNDLAKALGLKLDDGGHVVVDSKMRTSARGVYAAGDLVGGLKQIVTAVGGGAQAAISAFEDVRSPYWRAEGVSWD